MKVKIVGKTYDIQYVEKADLPNDMGECNDEALLIKIRSDIPQQNQQDVLLHEIIHAVDYAMNTEMTEKQVHAISTGLLGVLLDNPSVREILCMTADTTLPKKRGQKLRTK